MSSLNSALWGNCKHITLFFFLFLVNIKAQISDRYTCVLLRSPPCDVTAMLAIVIFFDFRKSSTFLTLICVQMVILFDNFWQLKSPWQLLELSSNAGRTGQMWTRLSYLEWPGRVMILNEPCNYPNFGLEAGKHTGHSGTFLHNPLERRMTAMDFLGGCLFVGYFCQAKSVCILNISNCIYVCEFVWRVKIFPIILISVHYTRCLTPVWNWCLFVFLYILERNFYIFLASAEVLYE